MREEGSSKLKERREYGERIISGREGEEGGYGTKRRRESGKFDFPWESELRKRR